MFLTYLTFAVALSLSAVAAFYSIYGLAVIFAAATVPIVIMGSILEVAKLVVTVWLHEYWDRARFVMKAYLVPAVILLMFITSMGIFGFLSRAHIEQTSASTESVAQVERIDGELARQKAIIERAEARVKQLETGGTGADGNVNAQIAEEQRRIDTALARVQPAIDEQQRIIDGQTKLYTDQVAKIDEQLAQLQRFIDAKEVDKAQALVGTKADGNWGPGTAAAVRNWQAARAAERADALAKLEQANNNPTIRAARDEIARIRRGVETQIAESNKLINRLREQLGQTKPQELESALAEQQDRIKAANKEIDDLTAKKYELEAQYRKLEAEVGPIKYIAELIYGEATDKNLLEKAVRWVIILIVIVFDPLAVMMLLAATESRSWIVQSRKRDSVEPTVAPETKDTIPEQPQTEEKPAEVETPAEPAENPPTPSYADGYTQVGPNYFSMSINTELPPSESEVEKEKPVNDGLIPVERDYPPPEKNDDDHEIDQEKDELVKTAKRLWKDSHPTSTLKEQRRLLATGQIDHLPWEDYLPAAASTSFGSAWPDSPNKGQMFMRTDSVPTRLYKYNGRKWIEVNKNLTDHYTFNDAYIEFLMDKIVKGEYDPELLTDSERSQIESRLK